MRNMTIRGIVLAMDFAKQGWPSPSACERRLFIFSSDLNFSAGFWKHEGKVLAACRIEAFLPI
jgi:hypothetical protein